jgi:hypothetical protein
MSTNSEQLWDAIYRIGSEDSTADKVLPAVIAMLIEFKMVELVAASPPTASRRFYVASVVET